MTKEAQNTNSQSWGGDSGPAVNPEKKSYSTLIVMTVIAIGVIVAIILSH